MKVVDTGYGNSGDLSAAREKARTEKRFHYLVVKTSGGDAGALGSNFNYEIGGTDKMGELMNPKVIRESDEILDARSGETVSKADLAQRYIKSLSSKQRQALLEEAIRHLIVEDWPGGR
jgi:hypothetical protein